MWREAERRIAHCGVRDRKLNHGLYEESGGRIVFQPDGLGPIDAYRKLLDQYETRKAFIVDDARTAEPMWNCFKLGLVYADKAKARFYFEKPYWEHTRTEMKAGGF